MLIDAVIRDDETTYCDEGRDRGHQQQREHELQVQVRAERPAAPLEDQLHQVAADQVGEQHDQHDAERVQEQEQQAVGEGQRRRQAADLALHEQHRGEGGEHADREQQVTAAPAALGLREPRRSPGGGQLGCTGSGRSAWCSSKPAKTLLNELRAATRIGVKPEPRHADCDGAAGRRVRAPWGEEFVAHASVDELSARFAANPSDRVAFEALEEAHFVAGRWPALVDLYVQRLLAPELDAAKHGGARAGCCCASRRCSRSAATASTMRSSATRKRCASTRRCGPR